MRGLKKLLNEIFIDGLSGMASGLFATLIIGTIIQQVGNLIPGAAGTYLFMVGKLAAAVTGAGIGCGAALRLKAGPLVILSAAAAGMTGAFAGKITEGAVLVEGTICLSGPGEPLGAFIAAIVGIYAGRLVTGKTKIDILVTPLACIVPGAAAGLVLGPPISAFMAWLGSVINWYYSRTQWNCRRSGDGRVLCQYGRVCRGFLPGKRGKRFAGARFGDEHAPDRQYCKKTCDLAAGDYNERSARPGFHDDIRDGE